MQTARYIKSLRWQQEREYASAYLAWLRGEADSQPWEGGFGLNFKQAQTIRRQLGTLSQ